MYCITVFAMSDVKANCCHRLPSAGRRWRQQDSCISLLILSFAIHQLCFHTFKCWLFKTCQQPRQVSHLLLSHDIQTFNQGHKIAAIYVFYTYIEKLWLQATLGSDLPYFLVNSQLNTNFKYIRWQKYSNWK